MIQSKMKKEFFEYIVTSKHAEQKMGKLINKINEQGEQIE